VSSHAGSGKSRMQGALVLMAALTKFAPKIHVVFPDEHLLNRDKADFEALWILIGCADKVYYHTSLEFERDPQDLLVIDEADYFIFDQQEQAFTDFIAKSRCVCFTATPSNSKEAGIEQQLLASLNFL
jgi:late competence protein required for DNA uptake (superfamily II DNA/RNA helicase)